MDRHAEDLKSHLRCQGNVLFIVVIEISRLPTGIERALFKFGRHTLGAGVAAIRAVIRDGNFPAYPEDSREYIILDCVMSGYIEMLLQFLDSGALSMEEAFRLAYYTMEHGTKPALLSQLGISDLSDQLRP